jgi:hypothetical protein
MDNAVLRNKARTCADYDMYRYAMLNQTNKGPMAVLTNVMTIPQFSERVSLALKNGTGPGGPVSSEADVRPFKRHGKSLYSRLLVPISLISSVFLLVRPAPASRVSRVPISAIRTTDGRALGRRPFPQCSRLNRFRFPSPLNAFTYTFSKSS